MARIEQQKADERVLQLLEKDNVRTSFFMLIRLSFLSVYMHPNLIWVPKLKQEEKEIALNKILQVDRQVDEKQKLELDFEQLKGKLEGVKHIEGEGVDVKKDSEELIEQLIERIEEMEDLKALNHALVVQHRMANDEIRDAKKYLITVVSYASIFSENLQRHALFRYSFFQI
jgi:hypothetical protein